MRRGALVALAAALLTAGGCDPCFGTSACISPHLMVQGVLYIHTDTPAAAGTALEFRISGGDLLADTVVHRTTDAQGRFRLEIPVGSHGTVQAELLVQEPGTGTQVHVGVVQLPTSGVRGDSRPLEIRLRRGVQHVGYVFWRYNELPARNVDVVFRPAEPGRVAGDSLTARTNAEGIFILRGEVSSGTELEGDLVLRPPAPYRERVIPVRLGVLQTEADYVFIGNWGVGLHLTYLGEIAYADGSPAGNVTVEYVRTGGLRTVPATATTESRPDGYFGFRLRPRDDQEGEVTARLTFRSPAGDSLVVEGVRMQTLDADGVLGQLGRWHFPAPDAP
jgi:hypothetical protein